MPDSGVPAAIGYAQESGIPYELGIIRNHYVGRTFIEPTQHIRQLGVRLKHSANRAVVDGKRIVLIDDSIVRGTTSVKIVQMMRDAGAREVHFRIASPPITHPDYYGIDTPEQDKLLAATHDLEGMRQFIGADSLAFLSVEGIYRAMGEKGRDPVRPQFTDHCFTGEYPTPLTDRTAQEPRRASSRCSPRRAKPSQQCRLLPIVSRSSPAPRAASVMRRRWRWRAPARTWWRWRARSAGSRNSTTRCARPAARRPWCRSTCATMTASIGSPRRSNERYQRLDVLVGNAAMAGQRSPLDHVSRRPGTRPWRSTSPPIGI